MYIRIKPPDGMVVVTAPYRYPKRYIDEFISRKEAWILKKQEEVRLRPLKKEYGPRDRERLAGYLREALPFWEAQTGLHPSSVQIRSMTSRWGSCNCRTGSVHFAVQLADREPEFIDYVIVHELCHLLVPNHGPEFKQLLDRFMPDWRERKRRQRELYR